MTREEQKKLREFNRYKDDKIKSLYKDYRLKKKDYMIYKVIDRMIYSVNFYITNKFEMEAVYYVKPFWLDDILWSILQFGDLSEYPVSLRTIGIFTIQAKLKKSNTTVNNTDDIDNFMCSGFEELVRLSENYTEDDFIKNYKDIVYQKEIIEIIVLLHNGKYKEALDLLHKHTNIRGFISGNKSFGELAIEYIEGL